MPAGQLIPRVLELCEFGLRTLGEGPLRDRILAIRAGLQEPLRVAVAGRVKAGKSTLVNALVRERIAPTGVGECTKVVTWFRYGFPERVTVEPRAGTPFDLPIGTTYALPDSLGAEPESIARVVVTLSIEALRTMTIIDTPGLASANVAYSAATRELLAIDDASRDAVSNSDAVVFVISEGATREDADALTAVRRTSGGPRASAVHSIGVLSKVDLLGDGSDVSERAATAAARQAELLRAMVSTVVPVIGLLAETAATGTFTEADAQQLVRLAALDRRDRERLLISPDRFRAADGGADQAAHERLLAMLDMYGIARCLEAVDHGVVDATSLVRRLTELSGVGRLQALLDETFANRADALKADRALLALERLAFRPDEPSSAAALGSLRNEIERVRLLPEMHVLSQIRALQACLDGAADGIPAELESELRRLLGGVTSRARLGLQAESSRADIQAEAIRGVTRWRAFVNGGQATAAAVRVADVVAQAYELEWAGAADPASATDEVQP
jgi:hypothetical protein